MKAKLMKNYTKKKQHVRLRSSDREHLQTLLSKGSLKARTYKRITALLALDRGQTYASVVPLVQLTRGTLMILAKKYANQGLECLYDAPRPGRPIELTAAQSDQITVLACEEPPEGHSQWSVRLLADKAVELGYCEHISHTQVHNILKKSNSNRT